MVKTGMLYLRRIKKMIFKKVSQLLKSGEKINQKIFREIFNDFKIQRFIITLVQDRLYDHGTDANNKKLRTDSFRKTLTDWYSDFTVKDKINKGLKWSNVTLKNTGEFYTSMTIKGYAEFYEFKAEFEKDNGNIADNFELSYPSPQDFTKAILSLSEEEQTELNNKVIIPRYIELFEIIMSDAIGKART